MKKLNLIIVAILTIFLSANANAQTESSEKINWLTFEEAVKFDAEQTESVEFMGHTFINPNQLGTQKSTHQLATALLQGKMSYPSYVFMSEANVGITVLPGYANAEQLLNALKYIATNAYLDTRWEDFLKQNNK